ncbi:tetratricopeptide repeat protein [uncultured Eudoraea sp.]|uniref:tetratricopeptide repeat protein n=1 Tax=uncultured Eudoraea sp. TaxID=1035614 RepID=UPI0026121CB8|nr:tetratricopeptide repeat protein [uncultured Eudoraea sp.]
MKKIVLLTFLISAFVFPQDDIKEKEKALRASTDITFEANKELAENDFVDAEVNYRRAISKSEENTVAPYNLGNAYYNQSSFSEAFGRFKQAGELASEKPAKHKAFHNMGNVFMKNKEYAKAVEAYKEALRNDPTDEETRYNLALAKELLKKDKNNQNKDDNKDKQDQEENKDKNQDKQDQGDKEDENKGDPKEEENDKDSNDGDKGDQEKEENEKEEGDGKKEENKQPEEGDQQQQKQPRPNQLSQQQIKNLLEAMQNEEKKVKEKMDAQKVKGVKTKNVKDW